jgi:lipopolysaccharide/colanic/teichoic acid biosynthesis glycosyltransferase
VQAVLGVLALAACSPLLICVALAILVTSGRPVLFRQQRIGLHERPFDLVKFRTMRPARAGESVFRSDAARVTQVGAVLRATSLDELPELWNVVRGEMAFVGPRPLLPQHLQVFSDDQRRRHSVKPGITGLAQISGRQSITFGKRVSLDLEYVRRRSTVLDVRIIFQTLAALTRNVRTGQDIAEVDDIGLLQILDPPRGEDRR